IFCSNKEGRKYIVEMPNRRLNSFIQKLEYYATRSYSDSLIKAANYLELKPVVLLAIANHEHKEQLKTTEDYWVHFLKEASNETEPPKEAPSEIKEVTILAILDDNYLIRTAKIDRSKEIVLKLSELGLPLDIIVNATGLLSLEITKLINQ
ncbi:11552_t:CDS:2, partial [Gigaspora rosea]